MKQAPCSGCTPGAPASPSRQTMLQGACQAVRGLPGVGLEEANWFWLQRPLWRFRDSGILGVGWGRVNSLGYTWNPMDPFLGREES